MILLEEVSESITSEDTSVGVESVSAWLGDRMSSLCGIRVSQEDTLKLSGIVRERMIAHSLNNPLQYFQLVESSSGEGVAEWEQLVAQFMNGETFFFRDSGQITLLQEHVLPTLIHRRKATRSLKILSAGCSTGEEPYSLAILVDQLLPDRENWDIEILGIDINFRAMQIAQQGCYGPWAFRKVDLELQQQYFQKSGSQWILDESIRKMVTFRQGNLFTDCFSSKALGFCNMDLIICRNVFLYFHDDAIGHVVRKMADALASDGYFLTGHGELPAQTVGSLQVKVFPDSVIYQRPKMKCMQSHTGTL